MLKEKVFQMFIAGTGEHLDYALENGLGGVIFFTHDIKTKEQFCDLVSDIKSKAIIQPFLSIDQEGGRVERTENLHTRYLSPKYAYEKGAEFLRDQTELIANELLSYGLNMNFAPCLDVNSNSNNPIIGERAFSSVSNEVCNGYDIVFPVYKNKDIIPVIKHFPGHGDADKDSHKELPQIKLTMEEMENIHILPFKHAINNGADAIMIAHLHCMCFDIDVIPTSLSKNCINYLKNVLNYKGLIISDDMYMNGVMKYGMTEACILGIKAGLNTFIYRNTSDETLKVIEDVLRRAEKDIELREKIEYSYNKNLEIKDKYNILN